MAVSYGGSFREMKGFRAERGAEVEHAILNLGGMKFLAMLGANA